MVIHLIGDKSMKHYSEKTILKMWEKVVTDCISEGFDINDEKEELIEISPISFQITGPSANEQDSPLFNKKMIHDMKNNFFSFEPQFGYKVSYGERIFKQINGISPIEHIIQTLQKKPEAKSATINMIKITDAADGHVPCLTTIDFKIRNGKIDLHYFARSQDIFKKSFADNISIYLIGLEVGSKLGLEIGKISGYLASAHIYKRDFPTIFNHPLFSNLSRT